MSRLEKLEETQRSTVRQKDDSETEGEGIQHSDEASNAIWGRNVGYNKEIELVRACDEERWRTYTEESVEGGYTREKEERTTENKMERRVSTRSEKYWTESGRGDGQGDVEKKDHQSYRRPYTMGKYRGKERRRRRRKFSLTNCAKTA